ncbi:MAG: DUF4382 domain-containing protein [Gallionella sp.]
MTLICSKSNSKTLTWFIAIFLAMIVSACGGTGSASAPGSIGISLTDAPARWFAKVDGTVVQVRVHQSSNAPDNAAGWADIALYSPRKINLPDLTNGALDELGTAPLAAGHYTRLRLMLEPNTANGLSNSVKPTGGSKTALDTPSAVPVAAPPS